MDAEQIRRLRPELGRYLRRFDDCFGNSCTRAHLPVYVRGQLSDLPRKSIEPIALAECVAPRTLQEFLSLLEWDERHKTPGVQRQYCGATGKGLVARDHASPHAALGLALTQHKKSLLLRRELTNTRSMFDRAREAFAASSPCGMT
jgi:hypothetical protein